MFYVCSFNLWVYVQSWTAAYWFEWSSKNWFLLGIYLKIPHSEMKQILIKNGSDIEKCKVEMLKFG